MKKPLPVPPLPQPPTTPCILWTGKISRDGYGRRYRDGRWHMAHRIAYEDARGPIPNGLEIDHLCRTKTCVNPDHLEAVTRRTNMLRQDRIGSRARQTHCIHGHVYDTANTGIDHRGNRYCKACHNASERRRKAAIRAARKAA